MIWTDEMVERAIKQKADNVSLHLIAAEIGVTHNALVGKLYRWRNGSRGHHRVDCAGMSWDDRLVERWADRKLRKAGR